MGETTDKAAEQALDPNTMDLDQLRATLENVEPWADEVVVTPEKTGDAGEPAPSEPAEPQEEAETTDKEPEEEAKEEPAEPDPWAGVPEHIRARIEEAEARAKHFESTAGRHAGRVGFLEQRLKALEDNVSRGAQGESAHELEDESTQPGRREPDKRLDAVITYAVGQAISGAAQSFYQRNAIDEPTAKEIAQYIQQSGYDPKPLLESGDPMEAAKEINSRLEEAHAYINRVRAEKRREEAERRSADQAAELKARKRATSVAGHASAPVRPKPKPIDPNTMPLDDLRKVLEDMSARGEGL